MLHLSSSFYSCGSTCANVNHFVAVRLMSKSSIKQTCGQVLTSWLHVCTCTRTVCMFCYPVTLITPSQAGLAVKRLCFIGAESVQKSQARSHVHVRYLKKYRSCYVWSSEPVSREPIKHVLVIPTPVQTNRRRELFIIKDVQETAKCLLNI